MLQVKRINKKYLSDLNGPTRYNLTSDELGELKPIDDVTYVDFNSESPNPSYRPNVCDNCGKLNEIYMSVVCSYFKGVSGR